jgi:hypothetical protein
MTTRDAGLTKEQVEAAEVHAAGSSHCGEIKSKSAFSRHSTRLVTLVSDLSVQRAVFTEYSNYSRVLLRSHYSTHE